MNTAQPKKGEGASARDAGPLKQIYQPSNCACAICGVKRFATLQAHLALAGFSMERATGGYYLIAHWSQTQPQQALELAQKLLQGGAP